MVLIFYLFVCVLGAVIGSFLGVIIDRSLGEKSVVTGRSFCDHCKHTLGWIELIPVMSYVFLGGKCKHCHSKLSLSYPIVEILTGSLFLLTIFFVFGPDPSLYVSDIRYFLIAAYFLYIVSSLVIIFFTDLKYGIIPFKIVFTAIIITFLWYFILPVLHLKDLEISFLMLESNYLFNYLISGLSAFLFFFIIFLLTKGRGMGFGDVVYAFLMGFILGFPNVVLGLYIAFLSGAFISVFLVVLRMKKLKGGTVPFGPFLILGTIISLFWGKFIIEKIILPLIS